MLCPCTLTSILCNHRVLELGSDMRELAPGPWHEAHPIPSHPRILISACVNTLA